MCDGLEVESQWSASEGSAWLRRFFEQCQFAAEVNSPRGSNFASVTSNSENLNSNSSFLLFLFLVLLFIATVFASLSRVRVELS